jgi:large subunit ribosomal protein L22
MARAILRRFRESPRKVRAVADMIRGRSVEDAMSILRMQQRKAARMLSKVLGSAIANATENEKADSDKLVVTKVFIDCGPVQKRWMARSMGRESNQLTNVTRDGRGGRSRIRTEGKGCKDGTENTSGRFPARRRSRLELEVVLRERLLEVAA